MLHYCRRDPDNGDLGSASAAAHTQKPTFTSRMHLTLFISASAPLTFKLPACWLVPVSWYYDSASHINGDLILLSYGWHYPAQLLQTRSMLNSPAGLSVYDPSLWSTLCFIQKILFFYMLFDTLTMWKTNNGCAADSVFTVSTSCQHGIKYKLVSPEWAVINAL